MDSHTPTDIISTLPTEKGWLSSDSHPLYYYQGFWYYGLFVRGAIAASEDLPDFHPFPTDTIVCSTPKSGTTWLKALSFAIATRATFSGRFQDNPLHFNSPHDLIPLIEVDIARDHKPRDPNLPLFTTHIPYTSLPSSILASGCKIVYIWRDPKDAFISNWHFAHTMRSDKDVTEPISLEEAFELFCRGVSTFGPYWDHVLGYWKAFLDRPDNILFLKFEDMMVDGEAHVKRMAKFMGYPFSIEEENEGVLTNIVKLCSFEGLSNLEVNKSGTFRSRGSITITTDSFFRKGKVGDWKNYLSEEMASKIDQITMEKLGKYGLITV